MNEYYRWIYGKRTVEWSEEWWEEERKRLDEHQSWTPILHPRQRLKFRLKWTVSLIQSDPPCKPNVPDLQRYH